MKKSNTSVLFGTLSISMLLATTALTQQPSMVPGRLYGGDMAESAIASTLTQDKGYVIVGQTGSFGRPEQDVWVLRYDPSGLLAWTTAIPGIQRGVVANVVTMQDGGFLISGTTNSDRSSLEEVNYGANAKAFLVKLDANGRFVWKEEYGAASGRMVAYAAYEGKDGQILLAGMSSTTNNSDWNATTIKTDAKGKEISRKILEEKGDAAFVAGVSNGKDGWILSGWKSADTNGSFDVWVSQVDASGSIQWQKSFDSGKSDYGLAVQSLGNGEYSVLAQMERTDAAGSGYPVILQLKADGTEISRTSIKESHKSPNQFITLADGSFVIAGSQVNTVDSTTDGWVGRYQKDGKQIWSQTFGGKKNDEYNTIVPYGDSVVVSGSYQEESGNNVQDLWVLQLDKDGKANGWETKQLSPTAQKILQGFELQKFANRDLQEIFPGGALQLAGQIEVLENNQNIDIRLPAVSIFPIQGTGGIDVGTLRILATPKNDQDIEIKVSLPNNLLLRDNPKTFLWGTIGKQDIGGVWNSYLHFMTQSHVSLENIEFVQPGLGSVKLDKILGDSFYKKGSDGLWSGEQKFSMGPLTVTIAGKELFKLGSIIGSGTDKGMPDSAFLAAQKFQLLLEQMKEPTNRQESSQNLVELLKLLREILPPSYQANAQVNVHDIRYQDVFSGIGNDKVQIGDITLSIDMPASGNQVGKDFKIALAIQDALLPNDKPSGQPVQIGRLSLYLGAQGIRYDLLSEFITQHLQNGSLSAKGSEDFIQLSKILSGVSFGLSGDKIAVQNGFEDFSADQFSFDFLLSDINKELAVANLAYQHQNLKAPKADIPAEFFPFNVGIKASLERLPLVRFLGTYIFDAGNAPDQNPDPYAGSAISLLLAELSQAGTVLTLKDGLMEMAVSTYSYNGKFKADNQALFGVTAEFDWLVKSFDNLAKKLVEITGKEDGPNDAQQLQAFFESLRNFGKKGVGDEYQFHIVVSQDGRILINGKNFPLFGN
ncbi:MAG: hypothetical protein IPP67_00435 [Rhodospirillaceae bacterium]|nr:hypothetical protein [Rhodospirillaceae bacterium]